MKKNVNQIKREDFLNPEREDEYGTSVMSIQFYKSKSTSVSIKNRYNHRVPNPDATYGNDLDRIIPGLAQSFSKLLLERGMKLNDSNIELIYIPGYVVAVDGKCYKYNKEINGIYYCPGNIIINKGKVIQLDPSKQVLMDYFILDKENKTVSLYDTSINDSFVDLFEDIEKIEIIRDDEKEKGTRAIKIKKANYNKPIIIEIDKDNNITCYKDGVTREVGNKFLNYGTRLRKVSMTELIEIGNDFLNCCEELEEICVPKLRKTGDNFLYNNRELRILSTPELRETGNFFLVSNIKLKKLSMPKLIRVGSRFLLNNRTLRELSLPELREIEIYFLGNNVILDYVYLPNLNENSKSFLTYECINALQKSKEKIIGSRDIAELDIGRDITTSEVTDGKRIIEDILNIDKNQPQTGE